MIDFQNVKNIVIPEGEVSIIARGEEILWQKQTQKYKAELAYLESTGKQYIDTGKFAPLNTDIEVRFQLNSVEQSGSNNGAIFGGRTGQTSNTCTLFYLASTKPQYFRFDRSGQKTVGTANQFTISTDSVYEFVYRNDVATIRNLNTAEDVTVTIGTPSSFTKNTLHLFAVSGGTFFKGKIYEWKYWEDGNLVQHFIPVLDWNDVPCMYDKVSEEFFYNAGTGEFLFG